MAGLNVPPRSTPTYLRRLRVGQAVSALHAQDWTSEMLFQIAGLGEAVADCTFNVNAINNASFDVSVAYARSPGAMAVALFVEWNNILAGHAAGHTATVTTTVGGSAAAWCGDAANFNGAAAMPIPSPGLRAPMALLATLDVTGLTVGAATDINLNIVPGGSYYVGLRRLHLVEVPLANALPDVSPATEPGVAPGFALAGGRLMDGSVASGTGYVRGTDQWLDAPRFQRRQHIQWATPTVVAAQSATTSFSNLDWCADHTFWSASYVPLWTMRARRLYSTGTPNAYTFRLRYKCLAASGGKVRLIVSAPTAVNWDVTLASASVWTTATLAVTVPTSGTSQEATLQVQALTSDVTKPMMLRNWCLIEAEQ